MGALAASKTVDAPEVSRHHGRTATRGHRVTVRVYSPGDTNAALDEASAAFREVLLRLPQLAMLETTVWRLAGELRKTQRRVNALQHIFIPNYEETVAFIVSSLEEREREETFRLKWLKTKMSKAQPRRNSLAAGNLPQRRKWAVRREKRDGLPQIGYHSSH
jgi:vacuolar-type H+-ATPase subunit D/Vma8